jgi:hypothetical protein
MPRRVAAHSSISSLVCTSCTMNKVGSLCGLAGRLEILKISGIVQRPLICPQRKKKDSTWAHNYPLNIYIHTEHELARILPIIAAAERSIVERSGSEIAVSDTLAHEIPSSGVFPEGVKRVVTVNAYERSTEARAACRPPVLHITVWSAQSVDSILRRQPPFSIDELKRIFHDNMHD